MFHFKGPGVGLAMYNTKQSITDFAQSSFKLAIEKKLPLVRLTSLALESRALASSLLTRTLATARSTCRPRTPS